MGWFTKKDTRTNIEKRPELPELPHPSNTDFSLPSIPSTTSEPPSQPSFEESKISPPPFSSSSKLTKDLSDDIYKPQNNEPKPGMQKSRFASSDFSAPSPAPNFIIPKIKEPSIPQPSFSSPPIKSFPKKDDSVFIKLDKFQVTMEAFRDIGEKIREIEDLLAKTKEIKSREEKELEDWEREIEAIKLKLVTIGKEITGPEV